MDKQELIDFGEQLREIGHRRRELAERVFSAAQDGDTRESQELYQELSDITSQAIDLMQKQRDILRWEVQRKPVRQA